MVLTAENEGRISQTGTAVPVSAVYLDDLREKFRDYLTGERACHWSAGDMIAKALGFVNDAKARRELLGSFAEVGHCTTAYCRQLAAVSSSFGTEYRQPDIAFSLYRACIHASRRTGEPAHRILERCKAENWHAADVAKLGRKDEAFVSLAKECGDCGFKTAVKGKGAKTFAGMRIRCPVCMAKDEVVTFADADGYEHHPGILGVLE